MPPPVSTAVRSARVPGLTEWSIRIFEADATGLVLGERGPIGQVDVGDRGLQPHGHLRGQPNREAPDLLDARDCVIAGRLGTRRQARDQ